jgi:hypothetical protein
MSDAARALGEAALRGAAAAIGPLIGLDLEVGEVTLDIASGTPAAAEDEPLAVLPVRAGVAGEASAELFVWARVAEIAALARRLLDDEHPDKDRPLSDDESEAVTELFALVATALEQAIRDAVGPDRGARAEAWWRTDAPGERTFSDVECTEVGAPLRIPSAGVVELCVRVPAALFAPAPSTALKQQLAAVLLLGVPDAVRVVAEPALAAEGIAVAVLAPGAPELPEALAQVDVIVVGEGEPVPEPDCTGVPPDASQRDASRRRAARGAAGSPHAPVVASTTGAALCRGLRLANDTWSVPTILCMAEPCREAVVRAVECGASHVLAVPADAETFVRLVRLVYARAE